MMDNVADISVHWRSLGKLGHELFGDWPEYPRLCLPLYLHHKNNHPADDNNN